VGDTEASSAARGSFAMIGPRQSPVIAALLMCGSTICSTRVGTVFKALVVDHGIGMLVTIRLGMQALLMLVLIPWLGTRVFSLHRPMIHVGCGIALAAGVALMAVSLRYVPFAQTYAIGFSAPLIATLIALVMFGERFHWRQALCIVVGFGGVIAALDPGTPIFGPVMLWPVGLALANALVHVFSRLGRNEDPFATVFWQAVVATAVSLFALPWTFEILPWRALAVLIGGCVAVTVGQLLMVEAFRRAPTAVVSPIVYAQFIWTAIAGALVFGEIPGVAVVAGAVVVAVSGIALVLWATPKPLPAPEFPPQ
jgi:drug/metabolite transporter (DMT)-like permease